MKNIFEFIQIGPFTSQIPQVKNAVITTQEIAPPVGRETLEHSILLQVNIIYSKGSPNIYRNSL